KDGPEQETLPLARSFASVILLRGQTGYLEDVGRRPDLQLPRPREGGPFVSVLAAPLRVRGRLFGTLEIYSRLCQTWTDEQVALIESLAAQTSISLEGAELVEAIEHERRRFEAVFATVPFGILVAEDPRGDHVRANPAAAAVLNVAVDEN